MERINLLELNSWLWIVWGTGWIIASCFTQKTKKSEGILLRLQHLLPMAIGFVLIFGVFHRALIFGPLYSNEIAEVIGDCLTAGGLLFAVWARAHLGKYWSGIITLKEGHRLIRTGPYRLVRHPIYTGFLLGAFGSAITAGTGDAMIGFVIMASAYVIKIVREEAVLTSEFGEEYARFKKEVAALVPFVF